MFDLIVHIFCFFSYNFCSLFFNWRLPFDGFCLSLNFGLFLLLRVKIESLLLHQTLWPSFSTSLPRLSVFTSFLQTHKIGRQLAGSSNKNFLSWVCHLLSKLSELAPFIFAPFATSSKRPTFSNTDGFISWPTAISLILTQKWCLKYSQEKIAYTKRCARRRKRFFLKRGDK
jgi:hypothetical protein